jgi:L-lactate dehydrogenase complex protein LldE
MKVALYVTCLVDQIEPNVGRASVALLRRAGCDVVFDDEQTCCGQPACNSGYPSQAAPLAKRVIEQFERSGADALVLPSGSCAAQIRHYGSLFDSDAQWRERAFALSMRTFELSWFLSHRAPLSSSPSAFQGSVAWHDSCHGLRDLGLGKEGRLLLSLVKGLRLVELPNADDCCGFGGTFAVKHPELSVAIADRKIEEIARSGVDVVTGGDTSCLMHLGTRLSAIGSKVRAVHFAELLAGEEASR